MDVTVRKTKTKKGGKKNRKYGRWSRGTAMGNYVASGRQEINAAKRQERHLRQQQKKRDKLAKRGV